MKPTGSYKGLCPNNIAITVNEKQRLWIQTIIDEIGAETGREAINYALREAYYGIMGDNGVYQSVKGDRKIRNSMYNSKLVKGGVIDRGGAGAGESKMSEPKLTGDTHLCNTQGTIMLRRENFEGEMVVYVDYPVIDRIEGDTVGDVAIVEWRTSPMSSFKREFIFGDLEEIDYANNLQLIKHAVLEKSFK
jgi:hypothetical protein